jgi:hypothetical protein
MLGLDTGDATDSPSYSNSSTTGSPATLPTSTRH